MGLAKFFINGLTSAENLGNPAYAAPEIWQGNIRDKRSDVWAMGKIISELCTKVRLPTNMVTALKIKETLKDNLYCGVVSKMVQNNPAYRAAMPEVIAEIRQIRAKQLAGAGVPNAGFGAQGCGRGTGAIDLGGKQKLFPPAAFSPDTRLQERPVEHITHNPSLRPQALAAASANKVPKLSHTSIPFPLPPDGKVVHRHYDEENGEMMYEEITTRNGKVVKYDDFKVIK